MLRTSLMLAGLSVVGLPPSVRADSSAAGDAVRAAVSKALPLLQKGAVGHREQRSCFACHNQGLPILALTTARQRGFEVDEAELARQAEFIAAFLARNRDNYLKGKGQGGQVDTAGYALWALDLLGHKPDEVTAAVTEYLLQYQSEADHWWTNARRPPSEASPFTPNYLALRALRTYGTVEQRERIAARTRQVRGWLGRALPRDTEDRVFRLWALKLADAPDKVLQSAAHDLAASQRPDGGFAQLDSMEPDAYATGTALVALHLAGGLATDAPVYQRGLAFLLKTQRADGTWLVRSRSRPFQLYFETGFPHGKDQFISSAASSWAATALALACASPASP
jgi:hypothetical protein